MTSTSRMRLETGQIAERVAAALAQPLPELPPAPRTLYTLARGSSDHAATVLHRLFGRAGIVATTLPPSQCAPPVQPREAAVVAISQSGASPDLCAAADHARSLALPVVSIVNATASPLAQRASHPVAQHAGEERAVAATKSVVCSIVAGARIAEVWGAPSLSLQALPERIEREQHASIDALVAAFIASGPLLVIGRGSGLGVAAEIALKVQELLGRPAMAYSSAEVLHGPAGMIAPDYPVLALTVGPEAQAVAGSADRLGELGARVWRLHAEEPHDVLDATVVLSRVYLALEAACRALGRSPDKPENLQKVTLTD